MALRALSGIVGHVFQDEGSSGLSFGVGLFSPPEKLAVVFEHISQPHPYKFVNLPATDPFIDIDEHRLCENLYSDSFQLNWLAFSQSTVENRHENLGNIRFVSRSVYHSITVPHDSFVEEFYP